MILVTGGAGFIGSNYILNILENSNEQIINLDKLTYAGNLENLQGLDDNPRYHFIHGDIGDKKVISKIINKYKPIKVINFAAESHVDRSIDGPADFIKTNIVSTFILLDAFRNYWSEMNESDKQNFCFLHVSTDEVYGSLGQMDKPFDENHKYQPNSPYSASKASSDHLVRAYFSTYGMPVITTNCSNNYGPLQFPEKLIPLVISNALSGNKIPVYGDGNQIRDWLYVVDHCDAIDQVLAKGVIGETYNIGGWNEKTNLEVINFICQNLDKLKPNSNGVSYKDQIIFIKDRPGHDRRYAINANKISQDMGWKPKETFETGMIKTIKWYLSNEKWINNIRSGNYLEWVNKQYGTSI
jgi:dTDP-glucose 4,6-dehydratase